MKKLLLLFCAVAYSIIHAQTYYSQNFNTGGLNGWTVKDLDGDGRNWGTGNMSATNAAFGAGSLVSYSWYNVPLTPDNLVTSPLIDLTAVTGPNVFLLFDRQAGDASYFAEHYAVYVTTTNVSGDIIATTPLLTETLPNGDLATKGVNLTSFIGQSVYISFRHYNTVDQYRLIVDNIEVKTLPLNDVSVKKVTVPPFFVKNVSTPAKVTFENKGGNTVTSLEVSISDGTNTVVETLAMSLLPAEQKEVTLSNALNYPGVAEKTLTATVNQVNGGADSNPANNTGSTVFRVVSQNSPKKVIVEEGTGTWCGWCPRGAVAMHNATINYPDNFIGIAVHNSDPMVLAAYNSGAAFSGFPSMNVDRALLKVDIGDAEITGHILNRKDLVVPAELNAYGSLAGNNLNITASATFRTVYTNANLRLAVVLIEDGVTGTASGYNQTNYYAGGGNGPMGGYENLPNPVPAAQMVYDHVGRALLGGYTGQAGSVPTVISDGLVATYDFTYAIPTTYNTANMHAVVFLLDASTGEILNARSFLLNTLGTDEAQTNRNYLAVYPNPTADYFKVQANSNVDVKVFDASGKLILTKSNVTTNDQISVNGFAKGVYIVNIQEKAKGEVKSQKLIVK